MSDEVLWKSVKWRKDLRTSCPYFSHSLPDSGEILYDISAHNAVERFVNLMQISAQRAVHDSPLPPLVALHPTSYGEVFMFHVKLTGHTKIDIKILGSRISQIRRLSIWYLRASVSCVSAGSVVRV